MGMMDALETAVEEAASIPGAFGAVLCDFEGESVVARLGTTPLSESVEAEARKHVPNALKTQFSIGEYLLRLAGAEPCALLMTVGRRLNNGAAGRLNTLEIGYENVSLVVLTLPEDFYLVIVLDRKRMFGYGQARMIAQKVRPSLVREIT